MKYLKDDHSVEQVLNQIEQLMRDNNLSIEYRYGFIVTDWNGKEYRICNVTDMSTSTSLPRFSDEERLVVEE